MDVGTISFASQRTDQYSALKSLTNTSTAPESSEELITKSSFDAGEAFTVELSDDAKQKAQQSIQDKVAETYQKDTEEVTEEGTSETKGLSADEVRYLEESIAMNEQTMLNMMIQALTDSNDKLQGWLDEGVGILNFDGVQIDASRFAMPEVATNPEDAAKAVADGGDWSVDAVSTRIFDLATAIAGDDPEKLSAMRSAVEQGFKEAGLTWTNATGLQDMPEITQKTYDEIMSRFDKRTEELGGIASNTVAESTNA